MDVGGNAHAGRYPSMLLCDQESMHPLQQRDHKKVGARAGGCGRSAGGGSQILDLLLEEAVDLLDVVEEGRRVLGIDERKPFRFEMLEGAEVSKKSRGRTTVRSHSL
jgi:hypothetical protein